MLALSVDTEVQVAPNIALHADADQDFYLAFNVISGAQYRLNETAHWVLKTVLKRRTFQRLNTAFLTEFAIDRKEGRADLEDLLQVMVKLELVIIRNL